MYGYTHTAGVRLLDEFDRRMARPLVDPTTAGKSDSSQLVLFEFPFKFFARTELYTLHPLLTC